MTTARTWRRRAVLAAAVTSALTASGAVGPGFVAQAALPAGDRPWSVAPHRVAPIPTTGRGATATAADRTRTRSRIGSFESGDLSEFDGWSAVNGSMSVTRKRSYDGRHAAKATNIAVGNQFQRVWYRVNWRDGSDVWYGLALYIPHLLDWCWWEPVRWDNYLTYGPDGDIGGVRVEQGKLYVEQSHYHRGERTLIGPVAIPEGRWFWLEMHQRLSGTPGRALSELYVDGVRRGRSTAANTIGRVINHIRYGNVAMATRCSKASSIYFDRVALSTRQLGPRG